MDLVLKYSKDILKICRGIDKANYKDLAQDVSVKMIETKPKEENIISWIYTVAKNEYLNNVKSVKSRMVLIDSIEHFEKPEYTNYKRELDAIIKESGLTNTERLWIKAYLEHNLCYSWIESDIEVSREHASKRIRGIINKIKCNLNY